MGRRRYGRAVLSVFTALSLPHELSFTGPRFRLICGSFDCHFFDELISAPSFSAVLVERTRGWHVILALKLRDRFTGIQVHHAVVTGLESLFLQRLLNLPGFLLTQSVLLRRRLFQAAACYSGVVGPLLIFESSDYPVRSSQNVRRNRETDLPRGLKIDNQLELRWLFDR